MNIMCAIIEHHNFKGLREKPGGCLQWVCFVTIVRAEGSGVLWLTSIASKNDITITSVVRLWNLTHAYMLGELRFCPYKTFAVEMVCL